MNPTEFIGEITADYLAQEIRSADATQRNGTTARYIIDCLHREQIAAIAGAIARRPDLAASFEVKVPERLLQDADLPREYLTRERATYFRHAAISKPALLVANTGDDEEQSLRELLPVGDLQLRNRPDLWVDRASEGLPIGSRDVKIWEKALAALSDLGVGSLDELARYTLRVRRLCQRDGLPLLSSLGRALPELKMPSNATVFHGIPEKRRAHKWLWKQKINKIHSSQAPLLRKQNRTGKTLTEAMLRANFKKARENIPEACHAVIEYFMAAPDGWNEQARALAEQEWNDIKPLFERIGVSAKFNFRKKTQEFYREREPEELLSDEERDYLKLLEKSRRTTADEEDEEFFDNHRRELSQEPKLLAAWEKFVYQAPIETDDFLKGLVLAMEALVAEGADEPGKVSVRSDRSSQKDFESLNAEAARYFVLRYRGVEKLFAPYIQWEVGKLFEYASLEEDWKRRKKRYGRSKSRAALQIKFEVWMKRGASESRKRLIWKFNKNAVCGQLPYDWSRIAERPLSMCAASKEQVRVKGSSRQIDLQNRATLVAAFGQHRGTLVSKDADDMGALWRGNAKRAVAERVLAPEVRRQLTSLFESFERRYTEAIEGFLSDGVAAGALERQAEAYGRLLERVVRDAPGDRNRELLLQPLMRIGIAQVQSEFNAAIVAPWQPLRLAAMARKARIAARLVARICEGGEIRFGDRKLYFRDLAEVLEDPFYPEVVAGWDGSKADLLSLSDAFLDYSLHVAPAGNGDAAEGMEEDARGAANQAVEVVTRFLKLYPHEHADLSVALFNPASVDTAKAVAEKLQAALGGEQDMRCRLVLLHQNRKRLATIYRQLVERSEREEFMATDGSRDFLSWLRIEARPKWPRTNGVRPLDILFTQDAISQHASLKWRPHTSDPMAPDRLVPPHWSRRRPAKRGTQRSGLYLTCPEQTKEGWAYLDALASLVRGERPNPRVLPVVELAFQDQRTKRIIGKTHDLANWVANYDRLLDRSHLESQDIRIIRWKQAALQGRSLLVSSNAETRLLQTLVAERLEWLGLPFAESRSELEALAGRMIKDASDISGDILLRAAKRGRSASELIGLVLSRFEMQSRLGTKQGAGWYLLDDYARRLGQREGRIADILALRPKRVDGGAWELDVMVSEAKYIQASSLAAKCRESERQLLDTMFRMRDALDEASPRLDRELWLSRLSDLLLDRVIDAIEGAGDSAALRRAIRDGQCKVRLSGYSHVFVYGPDDAGVERDSLPLSDEVDAHQEVFGPVEVRRLIAGYEGIADTEYATRPRKAAGPQGRTTREEGDSTVKGAELTGVGRKRESEQPRIETKPPRKERKRPVADPAPKHTAFEGVVECMTAYAPEQDDDADRAWLKATRFKLRRALNDFRLTSKVARDRLTPNAALIDFHGSASLTVGKVRSRQSELLTTYGLSVVSVRPKPGEVSIAIARPSRQMVRLQGLWQRWQPKRGSGNTDLLIGVREDDGSLQLLSPGTRHAPHTLIAGSTGSGKSVLMQNMLLAIAATNTPEEARITLVDPKHGVDYFAFEDLPHLKGGLIVEQEAALKQINALVEEMDRRYALLRVARAANLRVYNRRVAEEKRLPVLWLIHDEFAEWMLTEDYKKNVTAAVARLGVKARAAGIHLVFASQRPDANVMPPQLRDNLGNRLILRVNSEGTSELSLGQKGAERLLGRGHMLARLEDESAPVFIQVPFVEPEFIEKAVQVIGDHYRA